MNHLFNSCRFSRLSSHWQTETFDYLSEIHETNLKFPCIKSTLLL